MNARFHLIKGKTGYSGLRARHIGVTLDDRAHPFQNFRHLHLLLLALWHMRQGVHSLATADWQDRAKYWHDRRSLEGLLSPNSVA